MGAQRASDIADEDRREGERAITRVRAIQARIRARNPDMTEADWDELAERWAEEVNEGIRTHVLKQREEEASRRS